MATSRSVWKGSISFGLVNVPVSLHTATEAHSISFRQVHASCGAKVKQLRACSGCDEVVPFGEIAKGYEHADGTITILSDDDMAGLPLPTIKAIEVVQCADAASVSPMLRADSKSYYIQPDAAGGTAYALLADALRESGLVGIAKVALRQRESMAVLREEGGLLVLDLLLWADEVRAAPEAPKAVLPEGLRQQARQLVEAMAGDFDPAGYGDGYTEALTALVAAKAEGAVTAPPAAAKAEPAADLAAMLSASLSAAKAA